MSSGLMILYRESRGRQHVNGSGKITPEIVTHNEVLPEVIEGGECAVDISTLNIKPDP